jgi:hypothetical protein
MPYPPLPARPVAHAQLRSQQRDIRVEFLSLRSRIKVNKIDRTCPDCGVRHFDRSERNSTRMSRCWAIMLYRSSLAARLYPLFCALRIAWGSPLRQTEAMSAMMLAKHGKPEEPTARHHTKSQRRIFSPANNPPRRINPIDPISLNMYAGTEAMSAMMLAKHGKPEEPTDSPAYMFKLIGSIGLIMRSAQNNGYNLAARDER